MITNWDEAYDNSGHVGGSDGYLTRWTAASTAYRASGIRIDEDIAYGQTPREVMDLIWPDHAPKGLAVFVHGGYWMRLSKSYWTHLAEGARSQGWAVAMPSYTLAPDIRIGGITQQIGAAITHAAGLVAGEICVAGHSAGGHLVSRMICADTPLPADVQARVSRVTSISGVHDLRPLLNTKMNDVLALDLAEARAESPALQEPCAPIPFTAWTGGGELDAFQRQAQSITQMWQALGHNAHLVLDGAHNHFSVIDALEDPKSPLSQEFIGA